MPRTDPIQGITSALGTESPDGAANQASIVDQIVPKLNMRFATTTARDAAITPAGNRKAGMRAWIDTLGWWTTVLVDGGSWVNETRRDVCLGTEGAWVGSTPPAGTLKIRSENTVVFQIVNAAGGTGFSFLAPFPNGIISCVVTPGDSSGSPGTFVPILANCSLSSWNGQAYTQTGAYVGNGTYVRANYVAVGW